MRVSQRPRLKSHDAETCICFAPMVVFGAHVKTSLLRKELLMQTPGILCYSGVRLVYLLNHMYNQDTLFLEEVNFPGFLYISTGLTFSAPVSVPVFKFSVWVTPIPRTCCLYFLPLTQVRNAVFAELPSKQ